MLKIVLLVFAIVCFVLKAIGVAAKVDFMNLGFAFVVGSMLA
jgi:hypothetical protein